MANLLKLHEAIAVVLLNKPDRSASEQDIADEINFRRLYMRKDGQDLPACQVMQRTVVQAQDTRRKTQGIEDWKDKDYKPLLITHFVRVHC